MQFAVSIGGRFGRRPAKTAAGATGRPAKTAAGATGRPVKTAAGANGRPAKTAAGATGRPAETAAGATGRPAKTAADCRKNLPACQLCLKLQNNLQENLNPISFLKINNFSFLR